MSGGSFRLLLVEDAPADVYLLEQALTGRRTAFEIEVVDDGEKAIDFLAGQGRYAGRTLPQLLLLDLNLPCKSGRKVLEFCKTEPALRELPVVMLTTSDSPRDLASCAELGANGFITKPTSLDELEALAGRIEAFVARLTEPGAVPSECLLPPPSSRAD